MGAKLMTYRTLEEVAEENPMAESTEGGAWVESSLMVRVDPGNQLMEAEPGIGGDPGGAEKKKIQGDTEEPGGQGGAAVMSGRDGARVPEDRGGAGGTEDRG